jgi:glycosyltransferase involved in cell wall biosynthesis
MRAATEARRRTDDGLISVVIPASNEAAWIGRCLAALLAQDAAAGRVQILVAANACTDRTEAIVQSLVPRAAERGWELSCSASPEPGKIAALNRAEALVRGGIRLYLDADVICEPALLGQIRQALDRPQPTYATGRLAVAPARSWVTRRYAEIWTRLPFVAGGTVGAGLFAVNAAGRARWDAFPPVISDDTFVRLNFAPQERIEVPARYHWPMVEGWRNLVRVRRRQDAGVAEIRRLYPHLLGNEAKARPGTALLLRLAAAVPAGFAVYSAVALAVRLRRPAADWSRGR